MSRIEHFGIVRDDLGPTNEEEVLVLRSPKRHSNSIAEYQEYEGDETTFVLRQQMTDVRQPALAVHDSFIVHHGYAEKGEIEEIMRRAFYEEVGEHISKLDTEILSWTYRKDEDQPASATTLSVNDILGGDDDVSAWRQRQEWWYAERHS